MSIPKSVLLVLLAAASVQAPPAVAQESDRAAQILKTNDADGDGKLSRDEWPFRPPMFKRLDADGDGFLTLDELRVRFGGGEGAVPARARLDGQTKMDSLDEATLCGIGRGPNCDIKLAIGRGLFETGLRPLFPDGLECRDIDEHWAISYTLKRDREQYHGGIDMPAPWGTPMIAAADGTVVGVYAGAQSFRGMEIILRHGPQDTGIPLWIYTQYAHFAEMPTLKVGDRVKMGQPLGPTGNSGITMNRGGKRGTKSRRSAIHFAVWFSARPEYAALSAKIVPVEGYWMDPNALYRKKPPFDSHAMKALPPEEKKVPISVMLEDGMTVPSDTKIVWPYTCKRR